MGEIAKRYRVGLSRARFGNPAAFLMALLLVFGWVAFFMVLFCGMARGESLTYRQTLLMRVPESFSLEWEGKEGKDEFERSLKVKWGVAHAGPSGPYETVEGIDEFGLKYIYKTLAAKPQSLQVFALYRGDGSEKVAEVKIFGGAFDNDGNLTPDHSFQDRISPERLNSDKQLYIIVLKSVLDHLHLLSDRDLLFFVKKNNW